MGSVRPVQKQTEQEVGHSSCGRFEERPHDLFSGMFKRRLIFEWEVELDYFQFSLYSFCLRSP